MQKNEDILSSMSNLQPNKCLKSISKWWTNMQEASGKPMTPNVARTISCKARNSPAEYPSWVARCDIQGSDGTMSNPIFWNKVQGQKHALGEGLYNTKYLVSKCCLKQMPKVTSILVWNWYLSSESETQLVNQRKQNSYRRNIQPKFKLAISQHWCG